MKINRSTLYIFLLSFLLLATSCSDEGNEYVDTIVPLNCVYPGALELDQQTKGDLTKYKQSPLQEKSSPRNFLRQE